MTNNQSQRCDRRAANKKNAIMRRCDAHNKDVCVVQNIHTYIGDAHARQTNNRQSRAHEFRIVCGMPRRRAQQAVCLQRIIIIIIIPIFIMIIISSTRPVVVVVVVVVVWRYTLYSEPVCLRHSRHLFTSLRRTVSW